MKRSVLDLLLVVFIDKAVILGELETIGLMGGIVAIRLACVRRIATAGPIPATALDRVGLRLRHEARLHAERKALIKVGGVGAIGLAIIFGFAAAGSLAARCKF